jgi:hypothetical protein
MHPGASKLALSSTRRFRQRVIFALIWPAATFVLLSCAPAEPPDLADREIATVFATAGDQPTVIDLAVYSAAKESAFRLLALPESATLHESAVTLDHSTPLHEGIRISVTHDDGKNETLVIWHAVQPLDAPRWPLKVSENRRHLIDSIGTPQFWIGGSPWGLTMIPDRSDASRYLADRAGKGVNVVLVRIIDHLFSDQRPRWLNYYRHAPFSARLESGALDFTAPEEKYWRHVDWVIREAYCHGIAVLGAPAYIGYKLGEQGWADQMTQNGEARLRQYGEWLARRYRAYPNIVWVMGGDSSTASENMDVTGEVDAVAEGIKSVDTEHLMTAHSYRNRSALDDYDRDWLDINSSYGNESTIFERVRLDYERSPTTPTFLIEGRYGNERGISDQAVRAQMYNALLGGAFGQLYGNAPQWYFSAKSADYAADKNGLDWKEHLDDLGAQSIRTIADLVDEFRFSDLVPDLNHKVMTSGFGVEGTNYAPLAYSEDTAIAYLPERRAVTIEMSVFHGPVTAAWRHPVSGAEWVAGTFQNNEELVLTPPKSGDWILIMKTDN